MGKLYLGILLTLMMFGHNFVLNQTQTMQKPLQVIHNITITEFNLLYSIPSAVAILFIIPMGFFYQRFANVLLWAGALFLSFGQLLVAIFSEEGKQHYFDTMMVGRIFEGIGAQILYMIQGNMASSWMGKYAGVVFILPEVGEIANVFVTPWTYAKWGVSKSFFLGFLVCLISTISCILIYFSLRKKTVLTEAGSDEQIRKDTPEQKENIQSQKMPSLSVARGDSQLSDETKLPKNIFQAGRIFWLVILLCGVNECLYFPFLDNANELIINRFCIPFEDTGYYLSIPFIAAMVTSGLSSIALTKMERSKLIVLVSLIPLIGHSIIYLDQNCDQNGPTLTGELTLIIGFCFFGMGIGSYYSVSFPAVGLSVPQSIRGMGYACMGFFQTISMTLIPIFSGYIIESQEKITKLSQGYKQSSLLFVSICLAGVLVSAVIYRYANATSFIYDDEDNFQTHQLKEYQDMPSLTHSEGVTP